jgi:hypothetical protein
MKHIKFEIRSTKHETNPNDQNGSYGLPTLRAGPRFQMTKTEQTYIGFKVLFGTLGNSDFEFVSDFSF